MTGKQQLFIEARKALFTIQSPQPRTASKYERFQYAIKNNVPRSNKCKEGEKKRDLKTTRFEPQGGKNIGWMDIVPKRGYIRMVRTYMRNKKGSRIDNGNCKKETRLRKVRLRTNFNDFQS